MKYSKRCIVTGGAGFIGANLTRHLIAETSFNVLVIDDLTYAGDPRFLENLGLDSATLQSSNKRLQFLKCDICDFEAMNKSFSDFRPDTVFHLAAQSHVDRSIATPLEFARTNVLGTVTLLNAAQNFFDTLCDDAKKTFRFQHISTDEVYGSLGKEGFFTEQSPYCPHSPYSASKASSDHFVRAWHDTFGLPVLITNASNNYGPFQHPEKLLPMVIRNCLERKPIPVYGDGSNIRDWIYVKDHVKALLIVNERGVPGRTYNIGARNELANLEMIRTVCRILDELSPAEMPYESLITFVEDRPGHDFRYALDPSRIMNELGWKPEETLDSALRETVKWYLEDGKRLLF